jgi:predicted PurR-regulated permease PerM
VSIDKEIKLPFYAKASILFVGLFALLTMLYIARHIIVLIIFATIIAIVLHPVVIFFVRKRINRVIAIIISLLITFLFIAAFGALLFSQANRFIDSWPILVDKFTGVLNQTIIWASGYFDINPQKINEWIIKAKGELINTSSAAIGRTLITVGNGIVVLFLVPVYIFMILYYQPLLIEFIRRLFGKSNQNQVSEIVTQTKTVIQHYLKGLTIEFVIVATLYSVGLLILGIDYAILLGIIGALLNVIPYVGGFVAAALSMMIALATKSTAWYAFYVLAIYYFVHMIDYNYIIPKIVASKVKINALISITVVIVASALLGIPGMIICIPVTGIVKLIFDHIESLKPWGFLLGDTMPPLLKIKPIFKKNKKKSI